MAYIKAYSDENLRHPVLFKTRCTIEHVKCRMPVLFKEFRVPAITLSFTKRGGGHFRHHGYHAAVEMNFSKINSWLLVAHEFGHYLTWCQRREEIVKLKQKYEREHDRARTTFGATRTAAWAAMAALEQKIQAINRKGSHTKEFAANVDMIAEFILQQGWHETDLAPQEVMDKAHLAHEQHGAPDIWYKKTDLVKKTMDALPATLCCPKCGLIKTKEEFGVRVTSRSADGFPTRVIKQSYCRPCRSAK